MIPIRVTITNDLDEAMFDSGFGNIRHKVANALGDRWTVTNVTKFMGDNCDSFMVIDDDDESHYFKFLSTGTGVKCPGYFTNTALSMAFHRILDVVQNN